MTTFPPRHRIQSFPRFPLLVTGFVLSALTVGTAGRVRAQTPSPAVKPPVASVAPAPPAAPLPWEQLAAPYASDTPPTDVKEETQDDPDLLRIHITFTDKAGKKVTGVFLRPKATGVYPVVLLLHGLGSDKESLANTVGKGIASRGFASLALDADLHGERKLSNQPVVQPGGMVFATVMRGTVSDYRQALSYLVHRTDVDGERVGLLGYSMGAMMGSILSGVDTRIRATVLCVGGDPVVFVAAALPPGLQPLVQSIAPSNYVSHISPRPVYFVNGTQDKTMSEAAAKLLQEKAGEPKVVKWVDSGHLLPPQAVQDGVVWLMEKLKPGSTVATTAAAAAATPVTPRAPKVP